MRYVANAVLFLILVPGISVAQTRDLSPQTRAFVSLDTPVVALTNARVIDGTGDAARSGQTIIIREGVIQELGDSGRVEIPDDAEVLDLSGRTVLPGLVMVHEHMFYPAGRGMYNQQSFSFPRLYLAGGVTTIRTGGSMSPYEDLNLKRAIDAGQVPGPKMHVTGPYLNGPGLPILAVKALRGPDDARKMVEYWAEEGVTHFKAYMQISRAELAAAVEEAHARGIKVTGHLCSVTFREAADLGIDDLEHGFLASSDFVEGKTSDRCPPNNQRTESLVDLDPDGPEIAELIRYLVEHDVAITSTLPVFETYTPDRPQISDAALNVMLPEARAQYVQQRARIDEQGDSPWSTLLKKEMQLEHAFARAGGLLVAGTDPTGYGGVVAGFSNHREIELLVEAGFSPVEAISVATLNGAKYLEVEDRVGTIAIGKAADLFVVEGDPSTDIRDIRNVEIVFKDGIGYDSSKLIESTLGSVGLR